MHSSAVSCQKKKTPIHPCSRDIAVAEVGPSVVHRSVFFLPIMLPIKCNFQPHFLILSVPEHRACCKKQDKQIPKLLRFVRTERSEDKKVFPSHNQKKSNIPKRKEKKKEKEKAEGKKTDPIQTHHIATHPFPTASKNSSSHTVTHPSSSFP